MLVHLRANLILVAATFALCFGVYPLALLGVGQGLFAESASGNLVQGPDGKLVGSGRIAQDFTGPEWFRPRPSGVDYNAAASGGSNWGANNPKLRKRASDILEKDYGSARHVPADAVTASGSGLDPHISVANARLQLDRVANAWASKSKQSPAKTRALIEQALAELAFDPVGGLVGGPTLVNVLELNLEIARRMKNG